MRSLAAALAPCLAAALAAACVTSPGGRTPPRGPATGFVIAAGARIPVDVPVVTFRDAGGFDARRERRWFTPGEILPRRPAAGCDVPRRWSERRDGPPILRYEELAQRLRLLVVHYDAAVTSSNCFRVLHDLRGLSVHFLLDVDGTIYQTLDLAKRARHAGAANDASIGIEIAHPGAFGSRAAAARFFAEDGTRLRIPASLEPPPGGPFGPARPGWFAGVLNGTQVHQRDFTEAQYDALAALVRSLRRAFPRLAGGPPREASGAVRPEALPADALEGLEGVAGHLHVSSAKVDPGPAFAWERIAPGP